MWVTGLPFNPSSLYCFFTGSSHFTSGCAWLKDRPGVRDRKSGTPPVRWNPLYSVFAEGYVQKCPLVIVMFTLGIWGLSFVTFKAALSIHRRQRLIEVRLSFFSKFPNETFSLLERNWIKNGTLTCRWHFTESQMCRRKPTAALHAHKLLFLFVQLLYSQKNPDKTAISGCELDEGKYHA